MSLRLFCFGTLLGAGGGAHLGTGSGSGGASASHSASSRAGDMVSQKSRSDPLKRESQTARGRA